ncbi:uncharacterized protein METZ01_LOCUS56009 [marine metagenome]|uniref:PBP domain-containing protein n=1 Tax=marine metagenome TaxID=408172 RepID=A0A381SGF9_9ZZZZ
MKHIFITLFPLLLLCSTSMTLWGQQQNIILTGNQGTGSYIFATELVRLWKSSRTNNKVEMVTHPEIYPEHRLTQLENNRVSLAIIDAKTAHEYLNKHPGLRVLSVLWQNWLYVLGTVPGPYLTLESTQTLLVHDNSLYFAEVWKKLAPQTKLNWFNADSIPDFSDGFSEEVLTFTAPTPLQEVNDWLEQFPGIHLLSLDQLLVQALRSKNAWLTPQKLHANTFLYQTEPLEGVAWYPVLVVRRDFPKELVTTLLQMIFAQSESLNPHALFQNLRRTHNIAFQKIYNYHPVAKKMFRFK